MMIQVPRGNENDDSGTRRQSKSRFWDSKAMQVMYWVMKMMNLVPDGNESVVLGNENDEFGSKGNASDVLGNENDEFGTQGH